VDTGELRAGLAGLFSAAAAGDRAAQIVVDQTGRCLGRALSAAILILNLPTVIISGYFGPDGEALLPSIADEIRGGILPKIDFQLRYYPFDSQGFTRGAALLILKDYFADVPEVDDIENLREASVFQPA
jgi:predicted NBD/HSP70 family sugar kinase